MDRLIPFLRRNWRQITGLLALELIAICTSAAGLHIKTWAQLCEVTSAIALIGAAAVAYKGWLMDSKGGDNVRP